MSDSKKSSILVIQLMMEKHGIQKHSTFTGKERDEEKERSRGPFASERGDEPRSGTLSTSPPLLLLPTPSSPQKKRPQ